MMKPPKTREVPEESRSKPKKIFFRVTEDESWEWRQLAVEQRTTVDALLRQAAELYKSLGPETGDLLVSATPDEAKRLKAALLLLREADDIRLTSFTTALDNFLRSREGRERDDEAAEDSRQAG